MTALRAGLVSTFVVVALGCGGAAPPPVSEPSGRASRPTSEGDRAVAQRAAGEWRLSDRDAEARIDRAVAEVTDQMGFLVSGIANGRLDESLNPDRRVVIDPRGEDVVVTIGNGN